MSIIEDVAQLFKLWAAALGADLGGVAGFGDENVLNMMKAGVAYFALAFEIFPQMQLL